MPTVPLQTPGLYREEILPTPPLELRTGVPVFLGFAHQGPINHPQLLTLWPQFEAIYGPSLAEGYLAPAVYGFFANGGRWCYVVRLAGESTAAALGSGEDRRGGLGVLGALEKIDLVCVPDLMRGAPALEPLVRMQQAILRHCDQLGDRFALLDARPWTSLDPDQAVTELLKQRQALESPNGALYFPWVKAEQGPSAGKWVPPCGHIAGVYARTDQAAGVNKAPANVALEAVLDLQVNLTPHQQDRLNPEGVNCLRAFPGRGLRVWGARTLSRDPQWTYVNVRRLFLTLGRWLELTLTDLVFEPNDLRLWVRIERDISAYLADLLQQGALKGLAPTDAFFVKCDAETNPLAVREAGQVVTEIGIAPAVPNEFIVARLILGSSGVTVTPSS